MFTRSRHRFLLLGTLIVISHNLGKAKGAVSINPPRNCADQCAVDSAAQVGCNGISDTGCFCSTELFGSLLQTCLTNTCTAEVAASGSSYLGSICNSVHVPQTTSTTTPVVRTTLSPPTTKAISIPIQQVGTSSSVHTTELPNSQTGLTLSLGSTQSSLSQEASVDSTASFTQISGIATTADSGTRADTGTATTVGGIVGGATPSTVVGQLNGATPTGLAPDGTSIQAPGDASKSKSPITMIIGLVCGLLALLTILCWIGWRYFSTADWGTAPGVIRPFILAAGRFNGSARRGSAHSLNDGDEEGGEMKVHAVATVNSPAVSVTSFSLLPEKASTVDLHSSTAMRSTDVSPFSTQEGGLGEPLQRQILIPPWKSPATLPLISSERRGPLSLTPVTPTPPSTTLSPSMEGIFIDPVELFGHPQTRSPVSACPPAALGASRAPSYRTVAAYRNSSSTYGGGTSEGHGRFPPPAYHTIN